MQFSNLNSEPTRKQSDAGYAIRPLGSFKTEKENTLAGKFYQS